MAAAMAAAENGKNASTKLNIISTFLIPSGGRDTPRSPTSAAIRIAPNRTEGDIQILNTVESQHEPKANDRCSDLRAHPMRLRLGRPALFRISKPRVSGIEKVLRDCSPR